ncbi:MAG: hypothetical protein ABEK36_00370 [Candidatus Aenigmatarchaeota archaeon]
MSFGSNFYNVLWGTSTIEPFLPFFFVLAVVYGVLNVADIFEKKSVNLIISLVFAFFAIGYSPFVSFFFRYFGVLLWSFIIIFFIAFVLEALGVRKGESSSERKEDMGILIVGIVILIFITVIGDSGTSFTMLNSQNFLMVIGLVLFALIFYFAYSHGPAKQSSN